MKTKVLLPLLSIAFLGLTAATPSGLNDTGIYSASSNGIGLDLAKAVSSKDQKENTLVSPTSLHAVLAMVLEGVTGSTKTELWERLRIPARTSGDMVSVRSGINQVLNQLRSEKSEGGSPQVSITNGAWSTNSADYVLTEEFKETLKSTYDTEITALDFTDASAATNINSWVEQKTNGLIKDIVASNDVKDLLWLIVNTVYFEGRWEKKFYQQGVKDFHLQDGSKSQANMIGTFSALKAQETESYQAVRLPFRRVNQGAEYSLVAVLPKDAASLQKMQEGEAWDQAFWTNLQSQLKPAVYGEVTLPKFSFNGETKMTSRNDITQAMDLQFLFDGDFSSMATPESRVSKLAFIVQKTRIELDENGVKAAAVTAAGAVPVMAPVLPPPQFSYIFDRPFFFAIVEERTGALLFVGSVVKP